ncbi:hypothetical protein PHYBLDRAFT_60668 [Phycomyces blakesleeanus NRRL 1555(-)]|uniref:Uncharacterized protein n=1 Tax=Phycomyces blakesleeanus (strain ATCC 8743b / DSM 1359 / FGSC 10004 / NBRC 33097 / NRRL 1555) TaxID=763407 RepID=A0A162PZT9_PHYB8|nr:hypothetical protein PHYBLDRAFT_60668 [Phycomyces blakesleeanus NRRL 1555(-)]OAD77537.1 hypothetical protein PHYBLDRAFT_60668 [Phycomyces blakesleeanus NRRL 1555(-)]|eukprot:XP_018295577.1 hypothetical protein PHYBLDRAFT_60668 [Phycomyces blakesleeanus NRRL 1555(-)]
MTESWGIIGKDTVLKDLIICLYVQEAHNTANPLLISALNFRSQGCKLCLQCFYLRLRQIRKCFRRIKVPYSYNHVPFAIDMMCEDYEERGNSNKKYYRRTFYKEMFCLNFEVYWSPALQQPFLEVEEARQGQDKRIIQHGDSLV